MFALREHITDIRPALTVILIHYFEKLSVYKDLAKCLFKWFPDFCTVIQIYQFASAPYFSFLIKLHIHYGTFKKES